LDRRSRQKTTLVEPQFCKLFSIYPSHEGLNDNFLWKSAAQGSIERRSCCGRCHPSQDVPAAKAKLVATMMARFDING
jgi:hypothetical protein